MGVVGESGCGKSVTARSIMNMVRRPGRTVGGEVLYHRHKAEGDGEGSEEIIDLLTLPPMGATMRSIRGGEFAMIFQDREPRSARCTASARQIIEAILLHRPISRS